MMIFSQIDLRDYCEQHNFSSAESWCQYLSDQGANRISIAHMNVRSLRKNFGEILVQFQDAFKNLHVIVFTEINLHEDSLSMFHIPGFEMYATCRQTRRGGGVLIYLRTDYVFERKNTSFNSCETVSGCVQVQNHRLHILAVYRPPNPTNVPLFVQELENFVSSVSKDCDLIILGDTNIDTMKRDHNNTVMYEDFLSEYKLFNTISDVTREEIRLGQLIESCLDHILIRFNNKKSKQCSSNVVRCSISDHHLICLNIIGLSSNNFLTKIKKTILNNVLITQDLMNTDWSELLAFDCPLLMYENLQKTFVNVYQKHTKTIFVRSSQPNGCPWLTKELKNIIAHKDKLFKEWKNNPSNMVLRLEYNRYRNKTNKLVNRSQNKYKKDLILKYKKDYKKLWQCINKWLGREKQSLDEVILKNMVDLDVPTICLNFTQTFVNEVVHLKSQHTCMNSELLHRPDYSDYLDKSIRYIKVTSP